MSSGSNGFAAHKEKGKLDLTCPEDEWVIDNFVYEFTEKEKKRWNKKKKRRRREILE